VVVDIEATGTDGDAIACGVDRCAGAGRWLIDFKDAFQLVLAMVERSADGEAIALPSGRRRLGARIAAVGRCDARLPAASSARRRWLLIHASFRCQEDRTRAGGALGVELASCRGSIWRGSWPISFVMSGDDSQGGLDGWLAHFGHREHQASQRGIGRLRHGASCCNSPLRTCGAQGFRDPGQSSSTSKRHVAICTRAARRATSDGRLHYVPLRRYYASYTAGFFLVVLVCWPFLERYGMPPRWIGYSFLFLTIFLYATIGVLARTASVSEYYVAGRRVPQCSTAWLPVPTG
jgi:hypothetical protein